MGSIYKQKYPLQRMSKRRILFPILSLLYILSSFALKQLASDNEIQPGVRVFLSRKLLSANNTEKNESRCTEPSIREFPADVFSQAQRRHGAVLLHAFMAVYMFIALAFVCDDYFISALDKICERLNLSEDVAGATFMAAGSSAPELFTSIIGVFIAKGDVGVGTIVGSAVFNILIIISLCALFAGQVIRLTWWPLFRDSLYYTVAIAALIWSIYDGYVTWYESLVMLLLYIGYIILMKLNPFIVDRINARAVRKHASSIRERADSDTNLVSKEQPSVKYTVNTHTDYDMELIEGRRKMTWKELGMMIMLTDKFSPTTRFRAACLIVIFRGDHKHELTVDESNNPEDADRPGGSFLNRSQENNGDDSSTEIEGQPFLYPQGSIVRIVFWAMSLPLVTVLYFTIPDCRKPKWAAWYIATFICSIFWIMIFSYLMVWMVCVIGYTMGIPDVIMGITFLAAGTSIPDAISSLLVAREGLGDMAVSNSIGSNIFDILVGLAIPWFIKSAIMGEKVRINSRGMVYSVALLFLSVILTVLIIHCNKWRLNKKLGGIFIMLYLMFVTFSALIEFNVFGFVNYPVCSYVG